MTAGPTEELEAPGWRDYAKRYADGDFDAKPRREGRYSARTNREAWTEGAWPFLPRVRSFDWDNVEEAVEWPLRFDRPWRKCDTTPLVPAEQRALFRRAEQTTDPAERGRIHRHLWTHNLRLVYSVVNGHWRHRTAGKRYRPDVDALYVDLLEDCELALLRAVRTYDWREKPEFSTYAYRVIGNALTDTLRAGRKDDKGTCEADSADAIRELEIIRPTCTYCGKRARVGLDVDGARRWFDSHRCVESSGWRSDREDFSDADRQAFAKRAAANRLAFDCEDQEDALRKRRQRGWAITREVVGKEREWLREQVDARARPDVPRIRTQRLTGLRDLAEAA